MDSSLHSPKAIFGRAVEICSAAERSSYLDEACAGDETLRAEVNELLGALDRAGNFLGAGTSAPRSEPPIAEKPGTMIGPYKLLQQIGEGGMGVVYMAQQSEPVERRMALKIIKPGMGSRQVIARFEAERQALAVMDHPNIAKVVDAGTTESGRPYFVMELVKGVPITQYCDQHKLSVHERLELFVPVCQAIQHAHQKGIIHRDIKPSNVLVARYDERPVPKIIDFGVAKATQQKLTEKTVFTQFGQIVGTFEYMSPEQAQLNQLDIDTRIDVYSLGVLLYELLTGQTPFDGQRLRSAAFDELLRILREEDPPRPSVRLSTSGALAEAAANRLVEPKRLGSLVRGELDWIVMKALEKDRTRRYDTATALAADVEHYLNDEPVDACPPSRIYLMDKFIRRNKGWLSTAAVVLLTTLVGLTVSTVLIARERDALEELEHRQAIVAHEAERQRERAEDNLRQSREAVDRLSTHVADKLGDKPHMEQIRRELLEDALEFYQGFLKQKSDDPAIRLETADAYQRVGDINIALGNVDEGIMAYRQAIGLREGLQDEFEGNVTYRKAVARTVFALALNLHQNGRYKEAQPLYQQSLEEFQALARNYPTDPECRQAIVDWYLQPCSSLLRQQRRFKEAEQRARRGLAELERLEADFPNVPRSDNRRILAYDALARVLLLSGNRDQEAEECLRNELAVLENEARRRGQSRPSKGHVVYHYLTQLALRRNDSAEAESLSRDRTAYWQNISDQYPDVVDYQEDALHTMDLLRQALRQMGRLDEALLVAQRRDDSASRFLQEHPQYIRARSGAAWAKWEIANALFEAGERQRANDEYRLALEWFEQLANNYPDLANCQNHASWVLLVCPAKSLRDPEKSQMFARRALQLSPENADHWCVLGGAQTAVHDYAAAFESFKTARRLYGTDLPTNDRLRLALAYWQSGDQQRGRELYEQVAAELPDNPYAYPRNNEMNVLFAEVAEVMGITTDKQTDPPEEDLASRVSPGTAATSANEPERAETTGAESNQPTPNDEAQIDSEN